MVGILLPLVLSTVCHLDTGAIFGTASNSGHNMTAEMKNSETNADPYWIEMAAPYTYEDPAELVTISINSFGNPSSNTATVTFQSGTYSLLNWVQGDTNPDDPILRAPDWSSNYPEPYTSYLSWSDLGGTYSVPSHKIIVTYYTALKHTGAQRFRWWDDADAILARIRSVHTDLDGRFFKYEEVSVD